MKPLRLLDGLVLVAIYRVCLKVGVLAGDELMDILGESAGFLVACCMTAGAFIIFGFAARYYLNRTQ